MTYRDISHLCEMARVLSFPRLISMENFRQPNFRLVAELMTWLVKQYDPLTDVPIEIEREQDRVIFIRTVAQVVATKAHLKLNTKKLYQADGYAVKEILKVVTPLYQALRDSESKELDDEDDVDHRYRFAMNDDISTLKSARSLCSTITQKGAHLHELLGKEMDAREARQEVESRGMEISEVREGVREAEDAAKRELVKIEKLINNVQTDEVALDEKISKRMEEKERHERRLDMLKSVRPSFMNDFEKFEGELSDLYANYVLKYRILSYLEKELEGHFRTQREKVREVSRQYKAEMNPQVTEEDQDRFHRRYNDHNDDISVHSDEEDSDEDDDEDDDAEEAGEDVVMDNTPSGRGRQPGNGAGDKAYGGMTGDLSDDDDGPPRGQRGGRAGDDDDVEADRDDRRGGTRRQRPKPRATQNDDDDDNF